MMKAEIRFTKPILFAILIPLAAMAVIDSYQGWRLLLIALVILWSISYLWVRSLARHLLIQREIRFGWAQVGDRVEERFTFTNYGYFPALFIKVIDRSTLPDQPVNRITAVSSREATSWKILRRCMRRGLFTIGPTSYTASDPFGIYTLTIHDDSWTSLLVTPPVVPLPAIDITPGGKAGGGHTRSNAPEPTISAESVRQYQPGESHKLIHWRTSARQQELYVRKLSSTPASDWWIYLDLDRAAHYETQAGSSLEQAIILAASIASHGLKFNHKVGLAALGSHSIWLPPASGDFQKLKILHELSLIETADFSLSALLERSRSQLSQATSQIIISTWLDSKWIEGVYQYVKLGSYPSVFLLDPVSFGREPLSKEYLLLLHKIGVRVNLIGKQLLDVPEKEIGTEGEWQWLTSATGRAIPIRKPTDLRWRELDERRPG